MSCTNVSVNIFWIVTKLLSAIIWMQPVSDSAPPAGSCLSHRNTYIFRWKRSMCEDGRRLVAVVDFVFRQHAGWMMKTFFAASIFLTTSWIEFVGRRALRQCMTVTLIVFWRWRIQQITGAVFCFFRRLRAAPVRSLTFTWKAEVLLPSSVIGNIVFDPTFFFSCHDQTNISLLPNLFPKVAYFMYALYSLIHTASICLTFNSIAKYQTTTTFGLLFVTKNTNVLITCR